MIDSVLMWLATYYVMPITNGRLLFIVLLAAVAGFLMGWIVCQELEYIRQKRAAR